MSLVSSRSGSWLRLHGSSGELFSSMNSDAVPLVLDSPSNLLGWSATVGLVDGSRP